MSPLKAHRGGLLLAAVALVGAVLLVVGVLRQQPAPPQPPTEGLGPVSSPASPGASTPRPETSGAVRQDRAAPGRGPRSSAAQQPLDRSAPVSISIPAVDIDSEVFPIGLADDGSLAVPQPGPRLDLAAWFTGSPSPGQPGPSIIEGHVATAERGPSVFFELGALRPGDDIEVSRDDGRVVTFTVRALRRFDKDAFPTREVYGGDLGTPTLRLITCSDFDEDTGHHEGNLVVFSELTDIS